MFICLHSLIHVDSAPNHIHIAHQPLSKWEKFYMGKTITEEYAKEFDNLSKMERMGFDFNVSGISIELVNFGNVVRGIKREWEGVPTRIVCQIMVMSFRFRLLYFTRIICSMDLFVICWSNAQLFGSLAVATLSADRLLADCRSSNLQY